MRSIHFVCALVMLAGSVVFGWCAAKVFSWEAVVFVFCALYAVMSVIMSALMFLLATTVDPQACGVDGGARPTSEIDHTGNLQS